MGYAMSGITNALKGKKRIALDTCVFIYHFQNNLQFSPLAKEIFAVIYSGDTVAITSFVTLVELLIQPMKLGRSDIASDYESALTEMAGLEFWDGDARIATGAALIRSKRIVRTPDAIHLATAIAA